MPVEHHLRFFPYFRAMILSPFQKMYSPCSDLLCILLLFIPTFSLVGQNVEINRQLAAYYATDIQSPERLEAALSLAHSYRDFSTDSVLKYATISKELAEQLRDTSSLANAYRQLGWSRGLMQQNIAQLIQDVQEAKSLAEQVDDSLEIVWAGLDLSRGFLAAQKCRKHSNWQMQVWHMQIDTIWAI